MNKTDAPTPRSVMQHTEAREYIHTATWTPLENVVWSEKSTKQSEIDRMVPLL